MSLMKRLLQRTVQHPGTRNKGSHHVPQVWQERWHQWRDLADLNADLLPELLVAVSKGKPRAGEPMVRVHRSQLREQHRVGRGRGGSARANKDAQ